MISISFQIVQKKYPTISSAEIEDVYLYRGDGDFYIDALYIGRNSILPGYIGS